MQRPLGQPVLPPFPPQLRRPRTAGDNSSRGGTSKKTETQNDAVGTARQNLRSAIQQYHENGDDEALLEELHQALSSGLDEQSEEVAETLQILWDAEKSRAEIESASQMDGPEDHGSRAQPDSEDSISLSRSFSPVEQPGRGRSTHRGSYTNREETTRPVRSRPQSQQHSTDRSAEPPTRHLEYTSSARDTVQAQSATPMHAPPFSARPGMFAAGFPGSAVSNASSVHPTPSGSASLRTNNRSEEIDEASTILFLNKQLLGEQRSYIEHLQVLDAQKKELLRLQEQRDAGAPVTEAEFQLAELNVMRASQGVRSKKEMIDTLHEMVARESREDSTFATGRSTLNNGTNGNTLQFSQSHLSAKNASLSDGPEASNAVNLHRLELEVMEATSQLQTHRDNVVEEFGRAEAEEIMELLLNNTNMASTKYRDNASVTQLAAALTGLEQAQTRRNEFFLVGKIHDRQHLVREIKRITNPKIAKISKIIKKLSTIFAEADGKMDSVTAQQEQIAEDISQLFERAANSDKNARVATKRMNKLETKIAGIYKLLGITDTPP